ncbi:MAG: hypothetical protein KC417_14980, partial [Myxococcales bacterium]|nr:hypothetical protein [Myxococcales bacterium]
PGHVGAVASLAGDAGFEVSLRPMFGPACVAFEGAGGFGPFAERLRAEGPRSGGEYDAAFFVAAAAAYAPEPTAPFPHAALPVDLRTAEVIPAVWERWLAQDPLVRSETQEATDALGALTCLALDAGNRDEYGLHFAARALANRFRARGIAVDHTEFDGGHRGTTPRFEAVLPRVIAAIARR